MRMYEVDIAVKLSVCAHSEEEAKRVCFEEFQKGKYNMDGVIQSCKEITR